MIHYGQNGNGLLFYPHLILASKCMIVRHLAERVQAPAGDGLFATEIRPLSPLTAFTNKQDRQQT